MEIKILILSVIVCSGSLVLSETDPKDLVILDELLKGLDNADLLEWPSDNRDPCGRPQWKHVFCEGSRVTQIQVQGLGLSGPLPQDFNKLTELKNLGLQRNNFKGKLPSFSGLSKLQYAYLGGNQFDTIPSDFFVGLISLQVISLDQNSLNKSTGWQIPPELEKSVQLMNLSLMECNLIGPIPDFLGGMASLAHLKLSYNSLSSEIPATFSGSLLQTLWLNNQNEPGLTGSIDILASMPMLTEVWLHGNSFSGPIPSAIGTCTSLRTLWLNNNQLVGLIPENLTSLPELGSLQLDNNMLMGPIPKVKFNFTYSFNSFCQTTPGGLCAPEVTALLGFLSNVNFPPPLASKWSGNDPCASWLGVSCLNGKVSVINLPNWKLNGTINPSIGELDNLVTVRLDKNNLNGTIPENLTNLKSLKTLDVSDNNLAPPIPNFHGGVRILIDGNPLLDSPGSPSPAGNSPPSANPPSPSANPPSPGNNPSPPATELPATGTAPANHGGKSKSGNDGGSPPEGSHAMKKVIVIPIAIAISVLIIALAVLFYCFCIKGIKDTVAASSSTVVHPGDSSDPDNTLKIVVASNSTAPSVFQSSTNSSRSEAHVVKSGDIVISVQILRNVTHNFSPENELGRGGFGVVYKGELHDGTMIAVKRMMSAVLCNKGLDEFHVEISVLTKVRHRNLVTMLGYSVEDNERLLVYEYMPQGDLSKHLFHWKHLNLEPLSWKRRLNIALDVARAMEYLHSLAHQSFIHRDLKSSNILLDDDFRAKVADFGLVKLAPDGKSSVVTRLAGTFGYLAPEYAVTGKITTKADVFSYGVVLMELMTGLTALDEDRSEESRHLASWFVQVRSSKEKLMAAIDSSLDVTEETFESISIIAELAGHCTAREPHQRPEMGHAVNVLAPLVEKWKPMKDDQEDYLGIDLHLPLIQMVKGWQAADSSNVSSISLNDSKGSIPARPVGFAESFTSADGR